MGIEPRDGRWVKGVVHVGVPLIRIVPPIQLRWNPHCHALVEGGFDAEGTFVSIPFSGLQAMTEVGYDRYRLHLGPFEVSFHMPVRILSAA